MTRPGLARSRCDRRGDGFEVIKNGWVQRQRSCRPFFPCGGRTVGLFSSQPWQIINPWARPRHRFRWKKRRKKNAKEKKEGWNKRHTNQRQEGEGSSQITKLPTDRRANLCLDSIDFYFFLSFVSDSGKIPPKIHIFRPVELTEEVMWSHRQHSGRALLAVRGQTLQISLSPAHLFPLQSHPKAKASVTHEVSDEANTHARTQSNTFATCVFPALVPDIICSPCGRTWNPSPPSQRKNRLLLHTLKMENKEQPLNECIGVLLI